MGIIPQFSAKVKSHIKNVKQLTGDAFDLADINGNGIILSLSLTIVKNGGDIVQSKKTRIYTPKTDRKASQQTSGQKIGGELTNESVESVKEVKKWVDDNEK